MGGEQRGDCSLGVTNTSPQPCNCQRSPRRHAAQQQHPQPGQAPAAAPPPPTMACRAVLCVMSSAPLMMATSSAGGWEPGRISSETNQRWISEPLITRDTNKAVGN